MRTTLELDDVLMEALMSRHPGASKREAVEAAIREYLERDAISRVLGLKGGVDVEDLSGELRRDRG
jgi:Arc/MetJ family transcription regulator